mgnify:CR=1 FL=1
MRTPAAFEVSPDGHVRMKVRVLLSVLVAVAAAAAWAIRQDGRIEDLEEKDAARREWMKSLQEQVRELEHR